MVEVEESGEVLTGTFVVAVERDEIVDDQLAHASISIDPRRDPPGEAERIVDGRTAHAGQTIRRRIARRAGRDRARKRRVGIGDIESQADAWRLFVASRARIWML